jgi:RNA polymerase sigma-70 factor, ECF subfamily
MSSSITRYLPGLASRVDPTTPDLKDVRSSPVEGGQGLSQSKPAVNFVQGTANTGICSSLSDEGLIALISTNDNEALALLFRRYARIIRGVAYRVLRDVSEADDLLQDVFLLIHRLCKTFDSSKGPVRFWILQVAYRRAISRRRYLTSRHFYTRLDLDDTESELADTGASAGELEDSIDARLGNGGLAGVFESLSENQRQTLRLFFVEGYTFDEIAAKLGQSRGNVKHHYFRGLDRLRKQFFGGKLRGERSE